jgi:hypothetical protein
VSFKENELVKLVKLEAEEAAPDLLPSDTLVLGQRWKRKVSLNFFRSGRTNALIFSPFGVP